MSLPAADRYNILNAARLRSRLRMGLSMDQLARMFPNRMEFSKFQIERVKERNDLTQRLMNLNGMNDDLITESRVAGERGKEYVLVKNTGVEGGWALGVVGPREGEREKPIELDKPPPPPDDSDEDEDFEDVPIKGLNRLPHLPAPIEVQEMFDAEQEMVRQAVYESLREKANPGERRPTRQPSPQKEQGLFFEDEEAELFGESPVNSPRRRTDEDDEEEALRKAIALSMAARSPSPKPAPRQHPRGKVDNPFEEIDSEDEEFVAAVAENNNGIWRLKDSTVESNWGGLLPFERLDDAGQSLGRKAIDSPKEKRKKKESAPLPPWFAQTENARDIRAEVEEVRKMQEQDAHEVEEAEREERRRVEEEKEVVELSDTEKEKEVVNLESDDEGGQVEVMEWENVQPVAEKEVVGERARLQSPESVQRMVDDSEKTSQKAREGNGTQAPTVDVAPTAPVALTVQFPAVEQEVPVVKLPSKPLSPNVTPAENEDAIMGWDESDHEQAQVPVEDHDHDIDDSHRLDDPHIKNEDDDMQVPLEEMADLSFLPGGNTFDDADIKELEVEQDLVMADLTARGFNPALTAVENAIPPPPDPLAMTEKELRQLRAQQRRDLRDADEVNQQMIEECQELLQLFGLPYITAPQEAEAQCAKLLDLGLVDGIITDDSDIFLFGGTKVYRHFFNQGKFLEAYLASDLEEELALNRERLIELAFLLGSDYTEGIRGIGPITAMEILADFASSGGLEGFHKWWESCIFQPLTTPAETPFRKKFKRSIQKLHLPSPPFPNPQVIEAYLQPSADSDPTAFVWGVPDLDGLRAFLMRTVGWGRERTDEVLVPVVRERERMVRQANLTRYFDGNVGGAWAPRVKDAGGSRRLMAAVKRLKGINGGMGANGVEENGVEDGDDDAPPAPAPISMRALAREGTDDSHGEEEEETRPAKKGRGKRKAKSSGIGEAPAAKKRAPTKKGKGKGKAKEN